MHHGVVIDERLKIPNPFVESDPGTPYSKLDRSDFLNERTRTLLPAAVDASIDSVDGESAVQAESGRISGAYCKACILRA